jgi:molybdopterin synthase catalytic subunit
MIELREAPFNPLEELNIHQSRSMENAGKIGATSIFIGTMRDFNEGDAVTKMELEHYPGMTQKEIANIIVECEKQWNLLDVLVLHRVGEVFPDQTLVLVAVWSNHRGNAFDACRYIMEELKHRAPFWKKESLVDKGSRWVEKNTCGY